MYYLYQIIMKSMFIRIFVSSDIIWPFTTTHQCWSGTSNTSFKQLLDMFLWKPNHWQGNVYYWTFHKKVSIIIAVNRYLITLDDDFTQKSFQNLMAKLQDKAYMKCGEKSAVKFRSKKVKKIISSATSQ